MLGYTRRCLLDDYQGRPIDPDDRQFLFDLGDPSMKHHVNRLRHAYQYQ
jgi:hypothetical protein